MNKKRTKLEVVNDLLKVLISSKNVKITHLIYKANLSNNSIKPYIENLLKNSMIKEVTESDKKYYRITEKGIEFLKEFDKIQIFSDSFGI